MSWYIHPSKQLRDDELPPELVVTNRDGSIEQVYVPYDDNLRIENAKLRGLLSSYWKAVHCPVTPTVPRDYLTEMRELGIEVSS